MKLLNCPFCNGEAEFSVERKYGHGDADDIFIISCKSCGCTQSTSDYAGQNAELRTREVESLWNTRFTHTNKGEG